ncbi:MAG TPA: RdgB/HAM1 family non-canonical purine NTP pyrophosphatase [Candidatus Sulfotelmatobacter sp.]|nr:RdgB/HAM1 family non-canonical purine NTP pyrophosphatase [Candidatus Sulfotelmatobacter sp.]
MRVYVATTNFGKLREMESLFTDAGFELATYGDYEDPIEGDVSYAENAALKARALSAQLARAGRPANVLADDSGLEVYALDRRPGVLTAYYGGAEVSWGERRKKLLAELADAPHGLTDRRARFVSALHFIDDQGREFAAMGTVDGAIAPEERGEAGFSFDPVFLYPPTGKTFAEMRGDEKNRVSHRAIAAAALVAALSRAGVG